MHLRVDSPHPSTVVWGVVDTCTSGWTQPHLSTVVWGVVDTCTSGWTHPISAQ